jgi:hypothetical protein
MDGLVTEPPGFVSDGPTFGGAVAEVDEPGESVGCVAFEMLGSGPG